MENQGLLMSRKSRYWIGVASREHVLIGEKEGFAQFCHGKEAPAKRLSKGDWIVYYSGKEKFDASIPCQKFTAFGEVLDEKPIQVEQFPGFHPYRRKIRYEKAKETDIYPLIENLAFIKNKLKWGMAFWYGFFEISEDDFKLIIREMK
jgi:predicted RNA-binding protein